MRNKKILLVMFLFVLVFGMTFVACEDEDDPKDNEPVSEPLVINMPALIFSYGLSGFSIGVFPVGTTPDQADSMTGIVAGANHNTPGISYTGNDPVVLTVPLYDMDTFSLWTGSGTYDIYAVLGGSHYYKAGNVKFSSGGANITISSSNEIIIP
jgi:hypothetical protein